MKGPEPYLQHLGIQLDCPVNPGHPAVLDAEHRAQLNHEIFFFSSPEARAKFLAEPLRYCGLLTDPVSEARFRPTADSPRFDYKDRPYFFPSATARDSFEKDPKRFANAKRRMPDAGAAPASQKRGDAANGARERVPDPKTGPVPRR